MKTSKFLFLSIITFIILLNSCEQSYIPKPRGYYRIDFPKKEYKTTHLNSFSFDLSKAADIVPNKKDSLHWINIHYKKLKATIYLTYFDKIDSLEQLVSDAREMAYKHAVKADDIIQMPFAFPEKKVYGSIYNIEGEAASAVNFYITDSTNNFLRGALYFNCEINVDSLKPSINYLKGDIQKLLESFYWNTSN